MKITFRADASLEIGTGHIMRCLTLADELTAKGAECRFICREHDGNLIEPIRRKGYAVYALPPGENAKAKPVAVDAQQPAHAHWLGSTQEQDAAECETILSDLKPDWLIVDHYALDARWETALKPHYRKLMVIDDLADRPHRCDLLLDQTFGRSSNDYAHLIPSDCMVLCGAQYALLRPEFAALRPYSLKHRENPKLEHLLINMGGVDKDNVTSQVLEALNLCDLPAHCRITVVMGATAPWLAEVRRQAEQMRWSTEVRVGVSNMAQLMADSDLAIGAAGATSWERCCLGLPTVMLILADNQQHVAHALMKAGAALVFHGGSLQISEELPSLLDALAISFPQRLSMSQVAARITDGSGVATVVHHLEV